MTRDRQQNETMWYCPKCETWVGWKLDECVTAGHPRPRRPLRYADVDVEDARDVTLLDRVKAKLGWFDE